jgi:hypothetical protein
VDPWLAAAADRVAEVSPVPRERLELDSTAVEELLALAGTAAHASGQRTNAPLLCYLLGLAAGAGGDLGTLATAVRDATPDGGPH